MIDRKPALLCAALIVLMLAMAVWRIAMPAPWTAAFRNAAALPALRLFMCPACGALFIAVLSSVRARADAAKLAPWRKLGAFVSIGYCGSLLALQLFLVIRSLVPDLPLQPLAVFRTMGVTLGIMLLLAFNRIPKLPYVERRFSPGGDLGPIHGPRYVRAQSRLWILFTIALIAYVVAATPGMGWRSTLLVVLAMAGLMAVALAQRVHLGRKWKRQQWTERGPA